MLVVPHPDAFGVPAYCTASLCLLSALPRFTVDKEMSRSSCYAKCYIITPACFCLSEVGKKLVSLPGLILPIVSICPC